jgi:hypothetical protein
MTAMRRHTNYLTGACLISAAVFAKRNTCRSSVFFAARRKSVGRTGVVRVHFVTELGGARLETLDENGFETSETIMPIFRRLLKARCRAWAFGT